MPSGTVPQNMSVWQIPEASMRTRTSLGPGSVRLIVRASYFQFGLPGSVGSYATIALTVVVVDMICSDVFKMQ